MGQFSAHVGGGRGDYDQVSPVGQGDVFHLVAEIAVEGVHHAAVPGELLEGEGGDELGGVGGHDHLHTGVLLDQRRGQRRRLVGRNAPCDPEKNGFSL